MAADSAERFKLGDVVRLVAGGPSMTVVGYPNPMTCPDLVRCMWFDPGGSVQYHEFRQAALEDPRISEKDPVLPVMFASLPKDPVKDSTKVKVKTFKPGDLVTLPVGTLVFVVEDVYDDPLETGYDLLWVDDRTAGRLTRVRESLLSPYQP